MNDEIQRIISGKSQIKFGTNIQTAISFLRTSETTGTLVKTDKRYKQEETKELRKFITKFEFWITDIDLNNYVSEGAEQKVYLKDGNSVYKLNDAIYYLSWEDYFINLLLNNYFFPDTAYNLIGFYENNSDLYAVVQQQYIKANDKTDLNHVRIFMESNGFQLIRNNDYYNPEMDIILEDLHDENVLTNNGLLYFIDTVFYIK